MYLIKKKIFLKCLIVYKKVLQCLKEKFKKKIGREIEISFLANFLLVIWSFRRGTLQPVHQHGNLILRGAGEGGPRAFYRHDAG